MKAAASFLFVILLALVVGCRHHPPVAPTASVAPAAKPAAPTATLSVNPEDVQKGQSAQLNWTTANASSITIDGIGTVSASGSKAIAPSDSTTYHLVATNDGGSAEASARLTVTAPDTKGATLSDEEMFRRAVKDVFFNYDNAEIRGDAQAIVGADAQFLSAHPKMQLVLQGHCDERGSEEYNMALGQSRADKVKEALVNQGISADRIKLISFGKEKPFCTDANESCWSQNRRA
ncbi:MAG: peptidoglycan-associated lipoprotein Pal, partial [Candidatus Angelobacter sp.]